MTTKIELKDSVALINLMESRSNFFDEEHEPAHRSKLALPEILFITTFPPRECGIATYSQDLITALNNQFAHSFQIAICAIENEQDTYRYETEPHYIFQNKHNNSLRALAYQINHNKKIELVVIQHEFGLFSENEPAFQDFLTAIHKKIIIAFHTVLPSPSLEQKYRLQELTAAVDAIIVMTHSSQKILVEEYAIPIESIAVIAHGTHLVSRTNKSVLRDMYHLSNRKILSTFGLLSMGKSIETTLMALPQIISKNPDVLFLIIGKTHPTVVKHEGESYRHFLESIVKDLDLENHVRFINYYLPLHELLDLLQLTDIYLFTSNDSRQAVSGTFSYAISSGCAVVSTPFPQAVEVIKNKAGILIDFDDKNQLAAATNLLLSDDKMRRDISLNALHRMAPTAWENSAIAHAKLFQRIVNKKMKLQYKMPPINLLHVEKMTTDFGFIQFAIIDQPDLNSGYTVDDNARALIAICEHYRQTGSSSDLRLIEIYFQFLKFCAWEDGSFLNYVNSDFEYTEQNNLENLEDSTGRAMWALGYMVSLHEILPEEWIIEANSILNRALDHVIEIHSTRAMAFAIKGIYYQNLPENTPVLKMLANRLVQMYRHEKNSEWHWFEEYLTYGNSLLPEALLCAYLVTHDPIYKSIAKESFDFLLSKIFIDEKIKVISNKGWHFKNIFKKAPIGGEQPIDVAYTIIALQKFYTATSDESYRKKMNLAFEWFLGENHLNQIMYNPSTGGCYDGLEEDYINLNQGAESTISYLMARLVMEVEIQKTELSEYPHHARSKDITHQRAYLS